MIVAKRAATVAFVLALAGLPCVARAEGPAAAPAAARAEALFKEGRTLLDAKKYDEACPKLAESQRLDPGAGALLALALCHEGQGKTATAWAELNEAAKLGRKNGRADLAGAAQKRAQAMEPLLSRLVIRQPKEGKALADVEVEVDDVAIARSDWGAPFAVDPGEHRVQVSAKGKQPRSYVVRLSGAGTVEIIVDGLDDEPSRAIAASAPAPITVAPFTESRPVEAESRGGAQRAMGLTIAGLGVVGLGAGAYFGGKAIGDSSQSSPEATERAREASAHAIISATAGVGGLALGTILYLTAPRGASARGEVGPARATAQLVPDVRPTGGGLGVVGTF